jgi:hypothetical protein
MPQSMRCMCICKFEIDTKNVSLHCYSIRGRGGRNLLHMQHMWDSMHVMVCKHILYHVTVGLGRGPAGDSER